MIQEGIQQFIDNFKYLIAILALCIKDCLCHCKIENPEHYFIDCFLYSLERQILFGLIEHYVPYFKTLNKKQKLDIILRGVDIENEEILPTNITITKAVQRFIISSKRFSETVTN